jgi:integrase
MGVRFNSKTKKYVAAIGSSAQGTRVQKSFERKSDAEYWVADQTMKKRQLAEGEDVPYLTIEEALESFEASMKSQSRRHVSQVVYDVRHVAEKTGVKCLGDITVRKLEKYLVMDHSMTQYSVGKKVKHFKSMCKHVEKMGWYKFKGVDQVKTSFGRSKDRRALNKEEVSSLFAHMKENSLNLWYPIVFTMVHTGLRMKELACLQWEDIDFNQKILRVRPKPNVMIDGEPALLKNENSRRAIPMTPALVELLSARSKEFSFVFSNKEGGHIYNNYKRDFRRLVKDGGFEGLTVHILRHTFISHLLIYGKQDIFTVSKLAGHASIRTTQIYLTLLGGDEQKHRAVNSLPEY